MREIPLTNSDEVALVDDEDYERVLESGPWYLQTLTEKSHAGGPYVQSTRTRGLLMHRLVLGLEKGNPLTGDHINWNGLDNQRSNLRAVTHAQNCAHKRAKVPA